jgi:hypothetical protein
VSRGIRAHLGTLPPPDVLDTWLATLQGELKKKAEEAMGAAHLEGDALASRVAPIVFSGEPCVDAVPGPRIRSMAPPPERIAACRLRHAVTSASDPASNAATLVAMHDHVIVARWALDVARGTATIAQASGRHRPLSRPGPDVSAHWERIALARPAAAIGGGIAVAILHGKAGDVAARAKRWSELGEVPLDVAERELQSDAPR